MQCITGLHFEMVCVDWIFVWHQMRHDWWDEVQGYSCLSKEAVDRSCTNLSTIIYVHFRNSREGKSTSGGCKSFPYPLNKFLSLDSPSIKELQCRVAWAYAGLNWILCVLLCVNRQCLSVSFEGRGTSSCVHSISNWQPKFTFQLLNYLLFCCIALSWCNTVVSNCYKTSPLRWWCNMWTTATCVHAYICVVREGVLRHV